MRYAPDDVLPHVRLGLGHLRHEIEEEVVEGTHGLSEAERVPADEVPALVEEGALGAVVDGQQLGVCDVHLGHCPLAQAAGPRKQALAVVEDEVARPDGLELLAEAVVHVLLRVGAQQVAHAVLEVGDGLVAVGLGLQVGVDVAEPASPRLELHEVGRLRAHGQVHRRLRVVDQQRQAQLQKQRQITCNRFIFLFRQALNEFSILGP